MWIVLETLKHIGRRQEKRLFHTQHNAKVIGLLDRGTLQLSQTTIVLLFGETVIEKVTEQRFQIVVQLLVVLGSHQDLVTTSVDTFVKGILELKHIPDSREILTKTVSMHRLIIDNVCLDSCVMVEVLFIIL